jgi:putative tryptophan/tyrosine transport system substrate-binding protein
MRRREFIALGGAAAAAPLFWPRATRAQQPERMPSIAVLMSEAEDDPVGRRRVDALRQGLQELSWIDGQNIRIDLHWDLVAPARVKMIASDIVASRPDLIVSQGSPPTSALLQLTKTIPIVFVNVTAPDGQGFVASYARPGGNVTGFSNFEPSMGGKLVEVLKDLDPRIRRVAMVFNPETAPGGGKFILPSFHASGAALGVEPIEASLHSAAEIDQTFDALAREPDGGLVIMPDNFTAANVDLISRSALEHRLPLISAYRYFTDAGGLVSYGIDNNDPFHRAASYVDRILKGEKPADLPVQAPTKFELVVNLKTAKALGLTVSHEFLLRADDTVE